MTVRVESRRHFADFLRFGTGILAFRLDEQDYLRIQLAEMYLNSPSFRDLIDYCDRLYFFPPFSIQVGSASYNPVSNTLQLPRDDVGKYVAFDGSVRGFSLSQTIAHEMFHAAYERVDPDLAASQNFRTVNFDYLGDQVRFENQVIFELHANGSALGLPPALGRSSYLGLLPQAGYRTAEYFDVQNFTFGKQIQQTVAQVGRLYGNVSLIDLSGNTSIIDDLILGLDGPQLVRAGPGRDVVYGGSSRDTLSGGSGNDFLHGGDHQGARRADKSSDTVDYGQTGVEERNEYGIIVLLDASFFDGFDGDYVIVDPWGYNDVFPAAAQTLSSSSSSSTSTATASN